MLAVVAAAELKAAVAAALPVLLLEMQALGAEKGCCEVPPDAARVAVAVAAEPEVSAAEAEAAAAESAAQ